jgi:prevent-host-death family protein
MIRVNIHDAKTHLSRYIEKVEQGEVVVVCRHNKPVAEIRVITKSIPVVRKEGLLKGRVRWSPGAFSPMTDEEMAEFDGSPVFPR